jgi:(R,R)-butanediol dehydrogenase/meso-butanediol dehydrogenase/diacetyl reductase
MKAAVWYGHKDVRVRDMPEPRAKEGFVKIKIDYAGICGTDRHEYTGPNFIPVEKPHRLTGRVAPLIIGHEFSGVIAETGPGVTGWKAGDRVTANGTICCKTCEACRSGRYNVCERLGFVGVGDDGVFAEYALFDADRLFRIPDNVSQRQALLAEPLACGIHATRLVGGVEGKRVVVVGPGIIGLSCFFAAKAAGASRVLVAGLGEERRDLVLRHGGDYVDTAKQPLAEFTRQWSGGGMGEVVYECVGAQATLDSALEVLAPCAALMVMGVFEKPPVLNMNILQECERVIYTSQAHTDEIAAALDHISRGEIDAEELITREVTLDTLVEDGFEELLRNPAKHIKIAVKIAE